eukprot:s1629_g21.t1
MTGRNLDIFGAAPTEHLDLHWVPSHLTESQFRDKVGPNQDWRRVINAEMDQLVGDRALSLLPAGCQAALEKRDALATSVACFLGRRMQALWSYDKDQGPQAPSVPHDQEDGGQPDLNSPGPGDHGDKGKGKGEGKARDNDVVYRRRFSGWSPRMVGIKYFDDVDVLDVSKPLAPDPSTKSSGVRSWRAALCGFGAKRQAAAQVARQDALAVHVDVESENAATANHKEGDVEEAGLDADRHLVLQPEKLPDRQELDDLRETLSGLQSQLHTLRRDNGALRSALLGQTGGSLPVDVPLSSLAPESVVGSLPAATSSTAEAAAIHGEDELAEAVNAYEGAEAESGRGRCWQSRWFEHCSSCSFVTVENRKATSGSPPCSPMQADTSTRAGSWIPSNSSSCSPPRPVWETPLNAARERAWPSLSVETRAERAPARNDKGWSNQFRTGQDSHDEESDLEESDCPEAPPESEEEPWSPATAPAAAWVPGVGQTKAISDERSDRRPVLPFPNVSTQQMVGDLKLGASDMFHP